MGIREGEVGILEERLDNYPDSVEEIFRKCSQEPKQPV